MKATTTCPECGGKTRRWTRNVATPDDLRFVCVPCILVLKEDGTVVHRGRDAVKTER